VLIDDVIIAVRISTNDNDVNNNYNIYMKGQAKGIQLERWKWSCKGVSSVTGRRTVLYKMRALRGGTLFVLLMYVAGYPATLW
jgi:hypothetical protein